MGSQEPDDPHAMVLHHFGRPLTSVLDVDGDRGELETRVGENNRTGPQGRGTLPITVFVVPGRLYFTALQETIA